MEIKRHDFSVVDSTNSVAKRNAHLFNPDELTLITASEQTAGRGRGAHRWVSPAHENIYATFCFFLPWDYQSVGTTSLLLALSSIRVLQEMGCAPNLKWPNDLLVSEKKIGGVLCEVKRIEDKVCVMNGVGLNVNMNNEHLGNIDQPATSLLVENGHPFDVEKVLSSLITQFSKDLNLFLSEGFAPFVEQFKTFAGYNINRTIRLNDSIRVWDGVFHSINEDGSLNVMLPSREIKRFYSGQIVA
jgi:BirA family biotin operon repressor/biotin-[acetyl-CoA-carboxylase] ligase